MGKNKKILRDASLTTPLNKDLLVQMFEEYSPLVERLARNMSGDPNLAGVIMADTFASFIDWLAEGNHIKSNALAFLRQKASWLVRDSRKKEGRLIDLEIADYNSNVYRPVEDEVQNRMEMETLERALLFEISPQKAKAVRLKYEKELDLQETGRAMGIEPNYVKVLRFRAETEIKESIGVGVERV